MWFIIALLLGSMSGFSSAETPAEPEKTVVQHEAKPVKKHHRKVEVPSDDFDAEDATMCNPEYAAEHPEQWGALPGQNLEEAREVFLLNFCSGKSPDIEEGSVLEMPEVAE